MIVWAAPIVYGVGAVGTWYGLYRYWLSEFPDDRDCFGDWIGAVIWAGLGAIIWPIFALGYAAWLLRPSPKAGA